MTRFTVWVTEEELRALAVLADSERRPVRDQAALILRRELETVGLLAVLTPKAPALPALPQIRNQGTQPEAGRGA